MLTVLLWFMVSTFVVEASFPGLVGSTPISTVVLFVITLLITLARYKSFLSKLADSEAFLEQAAQVPIPEEASSQKKENLAKKFHLQGVSATRFIEAQQILKDCGRFALFGFILWPVGLVVEFFLWGKRGLNSLLQLDDRYYEVKKQLVDLNLVEPPAPPEPQSDPFYTVVESDGDEPEVAVRLPFPPRQKRR